MKTTLILTAVMAIGGIIGCAANYVLHSKNDALYDKIDAYRDQAKNQMEELTKMTKNVDNLVKEKD